MLKSVNREQYHEKSVKCIGQWTNSSSPDAGDTIKGDAMINVFFPAKDLVVRTEEVEFNRQLQVINWPLMTLRYDLYVMFNLEYLTMF